MIWHQLKVQKRPLDMSAGVTKNWTEEHDSGVIGIEKGQCIFLFYRNSRGMFNGWAKAQPTKPREFRQSVFFRVFAMIYPTDRPHEFLQILQ